MSLPPPVIQGGRGKCPVRWTSLQLRRPKLPEGPPRPRRQTTGKRRCGPKDAARNPGMSDPAGPFQRPQGSAGPRPRPESLAPAAPTIETKLGVCPRLIFPAKTWAHGAKRRRHHRGGLQRPTRPRPPCPKSPRPARPLRHRTLGPQPRRTARARHSRPQPFPGGTPRPRRENQTSSNPRPQRTNPARPRPAFPTLPPRDRGRSGLAYRKRARTVSSDKRRRRPRGYVPTVPWARVFNTHNASEHSAPALTPPDWSGPRATPRGSCLLHSIGPLNSSD